MIFGASGGFETIFKLTSHPEVIVIPLVWLLTLRRVRHLLYVNLLQSMRSTLYRAKTEMGAALNHFNRLVSSCWAVIKLNVMFCILVLLATQRFFSFAFWCQSWRIEMHRLLHRFASVASVALSVRHFNVEASVSPLAAVSKEHCADKIRLRHLPLGLHALH